MTELENFEALQEYNNFKKLIYTQEYLTKKEVEFVISWDADERNNMFWISPNKFLNMNVYSEHDHEKRGYELEIGG
jgi:hypothetical protein